MVRLVMVMMRVVVVPVMRRVRQAHIRQENQRDRNSQNLTHDAICPY
jgi:hypothetical protein